MSTEPIAGGSSGAVTGDGATAPLPRDVTRVLSYLAHVLDARIGLRSELDGEEFAALHLGVARSDVVTTTAQLSGLGFQLAALTFGRDLEHHPPVALVGETGSDAPRYEILELGAERLRVPYRLTAAFAAGTLAGCPLVVALEPEDWRDTSVLSVHARTGDADTARAWLDGLLERSRRDNPFRGRALEAVVAGCTGLRFRVLDLEAVRRADVVLPAAVWDEVDRNVHGLEEGNGGGARNAGVTTDLLLRLAGEAGYHPPTGQYL